MPHNIKYSYDNGIARITLATPPLNALDVATLREIHEKLDPFRDDPELKLLVLAAEGKSFSTGIPPELYQPESVAEIMYEFNSVVEHIHDLMIPSLALVRGPALGGGCELALFCDLVLADETATFGVPEVKLGLFAPTGAIILPQLAGRNRALELMLTGDVITAQTAATLGLINRVISAGEFDRASDDLIEKIASHSAVVLRFNHRAVDEARLLPFTRSIRHLEDMLLNQLMISEDAREGLAAYLQKRPPLWRNR
jgi:cyclohexa-1,5-dienecarbonyl-CoA hydratase